MTDTVDSLDAKVSAQSWVDAFTSALKWAGLRYSELLYVAPCLRDAGLTPAQALRFLILFGGVQLQVGTQEPMALMRIMGQGIRAKGGEADDLPF